MNDYTGAVITQILAAIGLIILAILLATPAKTQCLTKEQARQLWPKQHIYWYSKDHCWSNRRGPPTGIKTDPIPASQRAGSLAQAQTPPSAARPEPVARNYLYPIDANGNMDGPFEDYCCWPSLDALKALANGVEK